MANFEDKIRQRLGIPIEQGAQAAGQSVDDMYAKLLALQAMRRAAMPPQLPSQPVDTTSSSGGMATYDKQLSDEDKRRQYEAQQQVNAINNAEAPIDESQYKQYAEGGTVNGFQQLQSMMKPSYGKATAELDASKDPLEFIKKNKNMRITGKGVAF